MVTGYYTIIINMLSCEWVVIVLHCAKNLDIYCLLFTAFTVYTPAKAREHCYYLSYYVGCSCVDRNRYCTEYKKSWRTHSSNKQTFIPKCPIVANTPPSTMHCNRYVISDLLHSLVSRHVWRPLMNTSHPSLAERK